MFVMKGEIEKYKNEKETQINSIKQKAEEIHAKNKTIQGYEYKCSKNETRIKKQETQIRSNTENQNGLLKSNKKRNKKFAESFVRTNPKTSTINKNISNLKTAVHEKKQTSNSQKTLSDRKKIPSPWQKQRDCFTENNQNHKTNETEINNSTQQEHYYIIKKNAKANRIRQPVTKTKTFNHKNTSIKKY